MWFPVLIPDWRMALDLDVVAFGLRRRKPKP